MLGARPLPLPLETDALMTIELPRETRQHAVQSIERYFQDELDQRIGNIQAAALLNFFLQEIAPCVYNAAVRDVQERLLARVQELDIECQEDEFTYWRGQQQRGAPPRKR